MNLEDFHLQFLETVRNEREEQIASRDKEYPFAEWVFTKIVMQEMGSSGMTHDNMALCYFNSTFGNSILHVNGYALPDDDEENEMDLFVSVFSGSSTLGKLSDSELRRATKQCLAFLKHSAKGKLKKHLSPSYEAYVLASEIEDKYDKLDAIRVYVLTDSLAKSKNLGTEVVDGKNVKLEVMDIERLYRHTMSGKPRDELVVDFTEICGHSLPCIYTPKNDADYACALTVLPGESLRYLYQEYKERLLEANVRSFLSVTGKVNKGIQKTILTEPARFMAYNNGLVMVADEVEIQQSEDSGTAITSIKGLQIVNGGQTTASLYFTKKKNPKANLDPIMVPAKLIILDKSDSKAEEELISSISQYANSQNAVKGADLSANTPFHREVEKLSKTVYCPDGFSRWFYERTAGSYNVMLSIEGTTKAKLKRIKERIPYSKKLTKTALAKYLTIWEKRPHIAALGDQKNFAEYMKVISPDGDRRTEFIPDALWYRHAIAKVIIFKAADKIVFPLRTASKISVTSYLMALLSEKYGNHIDLDKIWAEQDISIQLKRLLEEWAPEVNRIMVETSNGKLLSEWAKKIECWTQVKKGEYSQAVQGIPEFMMK